MKIPTCTAPLGKTWKQCTRHGVYPDDKCHLHTEHLSGSHIERSRVDADRQRATNETLHKRVVQAKRDAETLREVAADNGDSARHTAS